MKNEGKIVLFVRSMLAAALGIFVVATQAQTARPVQPQLAPANLKAQLNRSAYALFLAESCSISTQILAQAKKVIQLAEESESGQTAMLTEFRQLKSRHADNSNAIGVAKRCYLEGAKTRSLISDVSSELEDMAIQVERKRAAYVLALQNWDREQREIAERREREQREAKERADSELRQKNQDVIERNADQLGKLVVVNKYDGGNNIGVTLKDWTYSESDKTATAKVEIRWYGKFTGKSYGADGTIRIVYDGASTWELGRNYHWNPTWLSSSLEAYLRCAKTLFGNCD